MARGLPCLLALGTAVDAAQQLAAAGGAALTTILHNGTVRYATDSVDDVAEALCVNGSRVAAAGGFDAVAAACPGAARVDLRGATVVPGMTDAHAHVMLEAARRRRADLSECGDATECAAVLAAWAKNSTGSWALGFGFDQTAWPGGAWPDKQDLDAVLPTEPARAEHVSGHACWVNSAALAAANITKDTPDPPGGGEPCEDQETGRVDAARCGRGVDATAQPTERAVSIWLGSRRRDRERLYGGTHRHPDG